MQSHLSLSDADLEEKTRIPFGYWPGYVHAVHRGLDTYMYMLYIVG